MKKQLSRCAAALLTLALTALLWIPALAEETSSRVLRVAFPQVDGLTETAADGSRYGLVVDYLNEIAKYTGWTYEYIDTDGESMTEKFLNGEFDLVGGTYYLPSMEQYFAYPDYNIGYNKAILLARPDDPSIFSYDLSSLNGKVIGVYDRAQESIRRLKEFLSANNLNCILQPYGYEQLSEDGNLYSYLQNEEVDLLLGNISERGGPFRVVASFDSQAYYFVTKVGNQEVLDGLNMALHKITASNPNYAAERYAANFSDWTTSDIQLDETELAYIREKGGITVAVTGAWHPLFKPGDGKTAPSGLTTDILNEISAYTGLTFTYLCAGTYLEAIQMLQRGEAELLGFFLGSEEDSAEKGLALSSSYAHMSHLVVRNKSVSYPSDGLVAGVIEGRNLPSNVQASEVRVFPDLAEMLASVNRGDIDLAYCMSARYEQEIQRSYYPNLVPITLANSRRPICFAVKRPAESPLLPLLNKAVNSIPEGVKEELLNQNTVSIGVSKHSLGALIYANPILFIVILAAFLLVFVTAILWISHSHTRAVLMKTELEKAEAESRAKGDFLSRMSHEIRTPMNAIVGLTDLIGMAEDVPKGVQENLAKLRASSHYLLELINDILDMSRIDGGMLSIAAEFFSLDRMANGIQSMMEPEAQRRKLAFSMEKKTVHGDFVGDAVRLRQVLTNLLSNAFKFTPAGGRVTLSIEEAEGESGSAALTFRVADTGAGISPEDQTRIFESFEQLGTSYSKSQGTGLGLPISRSIVRMMGGELSLKSELGRGSEFFFTVSLPVGAPTDARPVPTHAPVDMVRLNGMRILLAEDNDLNAEIAIQLLELQGAAVQRVENGAQAVSRFSESAAGEFQTILMDIQMPEMNGLEAARAIRKLNRPDAAVVPIIAMTANSFQEDVDAALKAGMTAFLAKPLDVELLYETLYEILSGGEPDL